MKKSSLPVIICACFLIFALLRYPAAMLAASAESASLWFTRVLPSLFPFMAACGLLLRLGAAERLGSFLQPVMKPLFGLPGICAFPFFLGILSGYPMGAKITAMLYEKKLLTKEDARHILVFSNNPGPLFLVGTVGAAFFHAPFWGYALLLSAFLGALATGMLWRFRRKTKSHGSAHRYPSAAPVSPMDALSSSVSDSMATILQIGGYMILFGALAEAAEQSGLFSLLSRLFSFLPVSSSFLQGICTGLLEMTNGAYLLSAAGDALPVRLTAAAFLVSFGGLSILGQTFGVLSGVPFSKRDYCLAKLCNAAFSALFFHALFPLLQSRAESAVPVFSLLTDTVSSPLAHSALPLLFFFCVLFWAFRGKQKQ